MGLKKTTWTQIATVNIGDGTLCLGGVLSDVCVVCVGAETAAAAEADT